MNESPHVLIVDDDKRIRELLRSYLVENGYHITSAASAAEAREKLRGIAFDAIVLDVMMPHETGLSLIASLRKGGLKIPVVMLSALSDGQDRIAGLQSGSDDYLAKPFEPQELLLRLKNLLRLSRPISEAVREIRFGAVRFDLVTGEMSRNGQLVRLTTREKDIMRLLAKSNGKPLSRLQLVQGGSEETIRSVDVQVNRLRQKIESDPANPRYLQTVRGAGYALFAEGL